MLELCEPGVASSCGPGGPWGAQTDDPMRGCPDHALFSGAKDLSPRGFRSTKSQETGNGCQSATRMQCGFEHHQSNLVVQKQPQYVSRCEKKLPRGDLRNLPQGVRESRTKMGTYLIPGGAKVLQRHSRLPSGHQTPSLRRCQLSSSLPPSQIPRSFTILSWRRRTSR